MVLCGIPLKETVTLRDPRVLLGTVSGVQSLDLFKPSWPGYPSRVRSGMETKQDRKGMPVEVPVWMRSALYTMEGLNSVVLKVAVTLMYGCSLPWAGNPFVSEACWRRYGPELLEGAVPVITVPEGLGIYPVYRDEYSVGSVLSVRDSH